MYDATKCLKDSASQSKQRYYKQVTVIVLVGNIVSVTVTIADKVSFTNVSEITQHVNYWRQSNTVSDKSTLTDTALQSAACIVATPDGDGVKHVRYLANAADTGCSI